MCSTVYWKRALEKRHRKQEREGNFVLEKWKSKVLSFILSTLSWQSDNIHPWYFLSPFGIHSILLLNAISFLTRTTPPTKLHRSNFILDLVMKRRATILGVDRVEYLHEFWWIHEQLVFDLFSWSKYSPYSPPPCNTLLPSYLNWLSLMWWFTGWNIMSQVREGSS